MLPRWLAIASLARRSDLGRRRRKAQGVVRPCPVGPGPLAQLQDLQGRARVRLRVVVPSEPVLGQGAVGQRVGDERMVIADERDRR
jgi:hypothetical protein